MDQIRTLAAGRTVLLISHRLANVVEADTIYVLDNGTVAEHGNQEELLTAGGVYAKLWETQQALGRYGKQEAEHEKAE